VETKRRTAGYAHLSQAERFDRLVFATFQLPFTGFLVATIVRDSASSMLRWCTSLSWFVGLLAVFEALEHLSVVRAARLGHQLVQPLGHALVPQPEVIVARRRLRRVLFETLLGTLVLTAASLAL
jgi:hypothetical protein